MGKIIAVILAAIFAIGGGIGGCSFLSGGNGTGDGADTNSLPSVSENEPSDQNLTEENHVSEIRIDVDKIYFDDQLCADENELKQKITDIGTEREYVFIYENAIKGTYDKVDEVLSELENALNITVRGQ